MTIRTKKAVAMGMLSYALFCFAVPETCRGDDAISTPLTSTGLAREQVNIVDNTSPSSSQELDRDDCYCCCSHIVPSAPSLESVMLGAVFEGTVPIPGYFRLLADPFFHPPRA